MVINQVSTDVSTVQRLLLGGQTCWSTRWFMESTEGSHVKTVTRSSPIQAISRGTSGQITWGPGATHVPSVGKRLLPAQGWNNTPTSTAVSNPSGVKCASKATRNFPTSADTNGCTPTAGCKSSAASAARHSAPSPVYRSIGDFVTQLRHLTFPSPNNSRQPHQRSPQSYLREVNHKQHQDQGLPALRQVSHRLTPYQTVCLT